MWAELIVDKRRTKCDRNETKHASILVAIKEVIVMQDNSPVNQSELSEGFTPKVLATGNIAATYFYFTCTEMASLRQRKFFEDGYRM